MSLKNRLKSLAVEAYLSDPMSRARNRLFQARRRLARAPRTVELYYQVGDPYSHLLVQLCQRLLDLYDLELVFYPVLPPAADADPEPALRRRYAPRDCRELAKHWQVSMPDGPDVIELDSKAVTHANSILIVDRPIREQLEAAREIGEALWSGKRELHELIGKYGHEITGKIQPVLATHYERLRKQGHYTGGTLYYDGVWYWGLDRIRYLESRLAEEDGERAAEPVLRSRPEPLGEPELLPTEDGKVPLHFFHSFRSPYSYLALGRTFELVDRHECVDLRIKPVLPMVMRGLPVNRAKMFYIVKDAKREADRLGIPFGKICDPVGPGVERCLAIFDTARAQGKEREYLLSIGAGTWSEARDPTRDEDLRLMVERAGIDWAAAEAALATDDWRQSANANRDELSAIGLWGVPSYKLGDFTAWGQDRIAILDFKLEQHERAEAAAPAEAPAERPAGETA